MFYKHWLIIIEGERIIPYYEFNPVDNDGINSCFITGAGKNIHGYVNYNHFAHIFQL